MRRAEKLPTGMQRNPSSHFVFRVSIVAISRLAGAAWQSLREWSGDAAYDRYLLIAGTRPGAAPLSRSDFYVEHLQRRYSRPSRCC